MNGLSSLGRFEVDIGILGGNYKKHDGELTAELVDQSLQSYPSVLHVIRIIKLLLILTRLDGSYTGGLGTLALISMIMSLVKVRS